jgi:hypothetical protein
MLPHVGAVATIVVVAASAVVDAPKDVTTTTSSRTTTTTSLQVANDAWFAESEKEGHTATQCWYRFDESVGTDKKTATATTHAYGVGTNWYIDTGATDHITGELEKLDVRNKYNGTYQVHMAGGTCMNISNIGHSIIPTPNHDLILKNILHIPHATKNLISVHRFTTDNHASLEYFPNCFLVKDLGMRKVLLKGRCCNGLYPLPQ